MASGLRCGCWAEVDERRIAWLFFFRLSICLFLFLCVWWGKGGHCWKSQKERLFRHPPPLSCFISLIAVSYMNRQKVNKILPQRFYAQISFGSFINQMFPKLIIFSILSTEGTLSVLFTSELTQHWQRHPSSQSAHLLKHWLSILVYLVVFVVLHKPP